MDVSSGSIATGPCEQANNGGVHEKCAMKCEWDGGCSEEVTTETCDCQGSATFTYIRYNYEVLTTVIYCITLTYKYNMFYNV